MEQEKFAEQSDALRDMMKQHNFGDIREKVETIKQDLKQSISLYSVLQEKGDQLNKERVQLEKMTYAADSQMKNPQNVNESQLPPPFVHLSNTLFSPFLHS